MDFRSQYYRYLWPVKVNISLTTQLHKLVTLVRVCAAIGSYSKTSSMCNENVNDVPKGGKICVIAFLAMLLAINLLTMRNYV